MPNPHQSDLPPGHSPAGIRVRLSGGLGNQMFQYAAGRALQLHHHCALTLDGRRFQNDPYSRKPLLLEYALPSSIGISTEPTRPRHVAGLFSRTVRYLDQRGLPIRLGGPVIHERGLFLHDRRLFGKSPPVELDGYWQNPRYFAGMESQLRADFQYDAAKLNAYSAALLRRISQPRSVAIHVRDYRREDLKQFKKEVTTHRTLDLSYYRQALAFACRLVPQPEFYIFGDEQRLLTASIIGRDHSIVQVDSAAVGNDVAEQWIMANSPNIIIANSTYSWWAAWLTDRTKNVIAPRVWFKDGLPIHELLPPEWISI